MLKQFYNWVCEQTGDYQIADNTCCPMAEFAKTRGVKHPYARINCVETEINGLSGCYNLLIDFHVPVYHSIAMYPHTFEALAERLKTLYAGELR